MLYVMLTGDFPFVGDDPADVLRQMDQGGAAVRFPNYVPSGASECGPPFTLYLQEANLVCLEVHLRCPSAGAVDLIRSTLQPDPARRGTVSDVRNHAWMWENDDDSPEVFFGRVHTAAQ